MDRDKTNVGDARSCVYSQPRGQRNAGDAPSMPWQHFAQPYTQPKPRVNPDDCLTDEEFEFYLQSTMMASPLNRTMIRSVRYGDHVQPKLVHPVKQGDHIYPSLRQSLIDSRKHRDQSNHRFNQDPVHSSTETSKEHSTTEASQEHSSTEASQDQTSSSKVTDVDDDLNDEWMCKICMEKSVQVVYLPCKHAVTCTDCSKIVKECPMCRGDIQDMMTIYFG